MPFEKGRAKTGGRTKLTAARRSTKFVEQLKGGGFDYVRELATALKAIKEFAFAEPGTSAEAIKAAAGRTYELKFYYGELKSLLPYMAPRLREVDVAIGEEPEMPTTPQKPVSDDDLLKALGNGTETQIQPASSKEVSATSPKPTEGSQEVMVGEEPEID